MYNLENEKKQKRKLFAIAGVMVAVILVLIAGIMVVANNKSQKREIASTNNAEFSIVDAEEPKTDESAPSDAETKEDDQTKESKGSSEAKEISDSLAKVVAAEKERVANKNAETTTVLPNTGATDLTVLALVLGVLTTGVAMVLMKKSAR